MPTIEAEPRERLMCLWDGTCDRERREQGVVDLGSSVWAASSSLDSRCRVPRPIVSRDSTSPSLDQYFPQLLAQDPLASAREREDNSDDMGYGGDGRPVRGLCHNCGRDGHHSRFCPEPRQERVVRGPCYNCGQDGHHSAACPRGESTRAAGGERPYGKGGGKGGQLAMDGSVAPFVLPLLPGPEEPSNSTMGKANGRS